MEKDNKKEIELRPYLPTKGTEDKGKKTDALIIVKGHKKIGRYSSNRRKTNSALVISLHRRERKLNKKKFQRNNYVGVQWK